jgi:peroxiredoxin/outer membrane lipoprotein-sorting protein
MMVIVGAVALEGVALCIIGASPERWRPAMIVKDEPAAHAVYDTMLQAIRSAQSLSYGSVCSEPDGRASYYRIWLAKPDLFHVAFTNGASLKDNTLVGDGKNLWVFWSNGRPYLWFDGDESYADTRSSVYLKKAAIAGNDSITGEIARLGLAWFECILDPGVFHGRTDVLDPYMDGIRSRGTDRIGGEKCNVIEISFMKAQRARYFWISRRDHLPRRIKEIVRGADNQMLVEEWSDVRVNGDVPQKMLVWSPPADWRLWEMPKLEDRLVKGGQEAPDFEWRMPDGNRIKLSNYRGKVVWLYAWQCGSPQCRQELPHLQGLSEKHKDNGLVVLGFNFTDDTRILQAFLRENPLTFPMIHDCSSLARRVAVQDYGDKAATMPMSCIINRQGRIVDAWLGYEGNHKRALAALEKAGLQLTTDN